MRTAPIPPPVSQLGSGSKHNCVVAGDPQVLWCWGYLPQQDNDVPTPFLYWRGTGFVEVDHMRDALCARYQIDTSQRTLHGALLDSYLLAEVYVELIGGRQASLILADEDKHPATEFASHFPCLGVEIYAASGGAIGGSGVRAR